MSFVSYVVFGVVCFFRLAVRVCLVDFDSGSILRATAFGRFLLFVWRGFASFDVLLCDEMKSSLFVREATKVKKHTTYNSKMN